MRRRGWHLAKAYLVQASARRIPLADGIFQTVMTSPPYWGLRSYGTNPQVWGGIEGCDHQWGENLTKTSGGGQPGEKVRWQHTGEGVKGHAPVPAGAFCQKCGAWRGELGAEPTPELFVEHTVEYMREVRRVLRADGTCFFNIGDSYAAQPGQRKATDQPGAKQATNVGSIAAPSRHAPGLKAKDLCMIPHRVALALQADGWWVRDTIIWHKPNPMPSSVTDRTTTAHEYVFLLTKSATYFYDADAIREPITSTGGASFGKQKHNADGTGAASRRLESPEERNNPLGRNKRSVWTIPTQSYHGAHFATFPTRLVEPCIKAGTSEKGCCPACRAPWRRVVERVPMVVKPSERQGEYGNRTYCTGTMVSPPSSVTVAWVPGCACHAGDPVPCLVFDPFNGSGTTLATAVSLGRSGVGTDLNAGYMPLARERINAAIATVGKPKKQKRIREPKGEPLLWGAA
jgi:DNA modification methylase